MIDLQWSSILQSAAAYFAVVFAAGFLLGTIRVTLLVPRLGVRAAELLEMPLMFVAVLFGARWVVRRFALPAPAGPRLAVGVLALGMLLAAEFSMVWLQGLTLAQWLASRDPVSGSVYAVMLLLFALMPVLVRRG